MIFRLCFEVDFVSEFDRSNGRFSSCFGLKRCIYVYSAQLGWNLSWVVDEWKDRGGGSPGESVSFL